MYIEFRMTELDYLNASARESFEERRQIDEEGKAVEGWVTITLPDDSMYPYQGDISFLSLRSTPKRAPLLYAP